ncbi:MAG: glycosyltransferase family 2 protein [Weeksellaceae bacterium]
MLSVCIPVYNHSYINLVRTLHQQCTLAQISFEILVSDDCSTNLHTLRDNKTFQHLSRTRYLRPKQNLGNDQNRNLLAKEAVYEWLLFVDADMKIIKDDFIQKYINFITQNDADAFSGGICYNELNNPKHLLRWKVGKRYEEINEDIKTDAYLGFRGSNFIIKKEVFLNVPFLKLPQKYGYQDTVFGINLKLKGYHLKLINNPAEHLGMMDSTSFLNKTEEAIAYALYLDKHHPEIAKYIKIIKVFRLLKLLRVNALISNVFSITKKIVYRNIVSNQPNLWLFQWYKLGYMCYLYSENKESKIGS